MKTRKTFSVLIFLLLFGGIEGWFLWQQQQIDQGIKATLSKAKKASTLLLGNSHMYFGLDPAQFEDAINLAYPSELLLFTYLKIKLLKPQIVMLALNPQHLQQNNEDALKNGLLSEPQYAYLYPYLSDEAKEDLYRYTPFEQWAFFKTKKILPFLGQRLKHPQNTQLLGGFVPQQNILRLNKATIRQRMNTVFEDYHYQQSLLQLKYLKKIIDYAQKQEIRLILVSFPLHPRFYQSIPSKVFQEFNTKLDKLQKIGKFEHWNYTHFFENEALFYDADHLNAQGAKLFSVEVKQRL